MRDRIGLCVVVAAALVVVPLLAACGSGGGGGAEDGETLPSVFVTSPGQDRMVRLFPIENVDVTYVATDPSGRATIDLIIDGDGALGTTADQFIIESGLPVQSGIEQRYTWDIGGVFNGDYWLFARMRWDDDLQVIGRAPGRITINGWPDLRLYGPTEAVTISRGGLLCYGYTAQDREDQPIVRLTLDTDGDWRTPEDGYALPLPPEAPVCRAMPVPGDVPPGTYRLLATADDLVNPMIGTGTPGAITLRDVSWAKSFGMAEPDLPCSFAFEDNGGAYASGGFGTVLGAATFGVGEANQTQLTGVDATWLARFNPDGTLAWARRLTAETGVYSNGVAVHPDGGFVLSGYFRGDMTLGAGEANETSLNADGDGQARFLARFRANGDLLWVKQWGTAPAEHSGGPVSVHSDGTIYMLSSSQDRSIRPTNTITWRIQRFSATGDVLWTRSWSSFVPATFPLHSRPVVRPDGSFLCTGTFTGTQDWGDAPSAVSLTATGTSEDAFIASYAGDGSLQWVRQIRATAAVRAGEPAVFADGSFAIGGSWNGTLTAGPGEGNEAIRVSAATPDGFVARFAASGDLQWIHTVSTPTPPAGAQPDAGSDGFELVAAVPDGSLVVHGLYFGQAQLTGTGDVRPLAGSSQVPYHLSVRYDANGAVLWTRTDNVPFGQGWMRGTALKATPDGSVLLGGWFAGAIQFGAGDATPAPVAAPNFWTELFLTRFNADGRY